MKIKYFLILACIFFVTVLIVNKCVDDANSASYERYYKKYNVKVNGIIVQKHHTERTSGWSVFKVSNSNVKEFSQKFDNGLKGELEIHNGIGKHLNEFFDIIKVGDSISIDFKKTTYWVFRKDSLIVKNSMLYHE